MHSRRIPLSRMYDYRRMLPHHQKPATPLFVTFCKLTQEPFQPEARDIILRACLRGHDNRFHLHAAVVMPDHVHLLLTSLQDEKGMALWPSSNSQVDQGSLSTKHKQSARYLRPGLAGRVLRSRPALSESLKEKLEYIRQNPVRRGLVKNPEDYRWLWVEQNPK